MGENPLVLVVAAAGFVVFAASVAISSLVVRDTIRGRGRWGVNLKRVVCPECGEPAPAIRKPQNLRQALWGGCTCSVCGTEYDKWGHPVGTSAGSGTPPTDSW